LRTREVERHDVDVTMTAPERADQLRAASRCARTEHTVAFGVASELDESL